MATSRPQRGIRKSQPQTPPSTPSSTLSVSSCGGDTARTGAQGDAGGQFLLASLGPYQKQVGDVGAGDEQHHSDAAHEHPENLAQIAHDVVLQRPHRGLDSGLLEEFYAEAGRRREFAVDDGNHARDIGIRLRQRHSRLEPGNGRGS